MSLNGDYLSLAEAVGEAPPRALAFDALDFDELLHDAGGDLDEAHRTMTLMMDRDMSARLRIMEDENEDLRAELDELRMVRGELIA